MILPLNAVLPSRQIPVHDHYPPKFRTTFAILKYRHQDRQQNRLD